MNDFARILEDFFVKYLSVERGCSINTRKNYRDTFVELFAFLNETLDIPSNKICMETFIDSRNLEPADQDSSVG